MEDLRRAQPQLAKRNALFGHPRLAIHNSDAAPNALGCVYCGLCLSGCPRGSIYSTVPELLSLHRRGQIEYRQALSSKKSGLWATRSPSRPPIPRRASGTSRPSTPVFIGAGPINTARILLASRKLFDRRVTMMESQKFLVPALRLPDAPQALDEKTIVLACALLEMKAPEISEHWIQVQLSPINDLVLSRARHEPGSARLRLSKGPARPLLRRMMVAWCGLHSDHSSRLTMTLRRGEDQEPHTMIVEGNLSREARGVARRAARRLFRLGLLFRTAFLFPLLRYSDPGAGNHFGGAFPMSTFPQREFESDVFGRVFGWRRVFAVDTSIFPSIPATTIALSVMANARRIGATAPIS